jgi:lipopolysaccharide/colanic/teichoic acid biosynthesis glycosyltransferase
MFDAEPVTCDVGSPYDGMGFRWQQTGFLTFKRLFDLFVSLALLPAMIATGLVLVIVNPVLNPGRLFYVQERMGRGGRTIRVVKFRSMADSAAPNRGAFDALEHQRIGRLGRLLRKSRLDELPQILNVLTGEMSVIGPRPDFLPHARTYLETVPGYKDRLVVRPGISGYAQVVHGYVDGLDGVRRKVSSDLHYIRHASVRFDLWIAWHSFLTVVFRRGM